MVKFENQTKSSRETKEETIESINEEITEAVKAGDYDKVAELGKKAKEIEEKKQKMKKGSINDRAEHFNKDGEVKNQKNSRETVAEQAEDKEVESHIEANKEQIKGAAEGWLKAKEEGFLKKNEWMLKLAGMGATVAGSVETALHYFNNSDVMSFGSSEAIVASVAVLAVAFGGAIAGGIAGKFADYFKRKKLKKKSV